MRVSSVIASLTLGCLFGALPCAARAADPGFGVELFDPLPSQGLNILDVATSRVLGHGHFSGGVFSHYEDDPLTYVSHDDSSQVLARFIDARVSLEVMLAVGFFDIIELGVVLPLTVYQTGDDLAPLGGSGGTVGGFSLGDLRVLPKFRILGKDGDEGGFGLHLDCPVYVPIGARDQFGSDGALRLTPLLGVDYTFSGVTLAINAGWEFRAKRPSGGYVSDDLLRWSFGARVPLGTPVLSLLATVRGAAAILGKDAGLPDAKLSLPTEAAGALELRVAGGLVISAGGGATIVRGVGSPDVRAFFGISWTPPASADADGDGVSDADDKCPSEKEDDDGFEDDDGCPDPDNDKDGILDAMDRCPNKAETKNGIDDGDGCPESDADSDGILDGPDRCPDKAEDRDGFQDDDGCPDPDNDGDGVPDTDDKCQDSLEDRDGFKDDDGCADPDNDGDGILDGLDRCPDQAESKNGIADDDGCPEPDADNDGVPDPSDKCPNRAETKNGYLDDDGCPDTTQKLVTITESMLLTKQPIPFVRGIDAIPKPALPVLDAVAGALTDLTYITKMRIESHTDSEGDAEANRQMTLRRAEAVKAYLISKGIAAERLETAGYGEDRPAATNMTPGGRAQNRRVEFRIRAIDGQALPEPEVPKSP